MKNKQDKMLDELKKETQRGILKTIYVKDADLWRRFKAKIGSIPHSKVIMRLIEEFVDGDRKKKG